MWDADGEPIPRRCAPMDGPDRHKIAVPNADVADTIVVTADGGRHFAVAAAEATIEPARALDPTRPLFTVHASTARPARSSPATTSAAPGTRSRSPPPPSPSASPRA